jgi:trigger factor
LQISNKQCSNETPKFAIFDESAKLELDMKIERENLSPTEIRVKIEMTKEDWQPYLDRKLEKYAKTLKVPGFRPGKIPKNVVLNQLGRNAVENETLEEAVDELYNDYLKQQQLTALGRPQTSIINAPIDQKDPLVLVELTQEIFPQVEIPDAKEIAIEIEDQASIEKSLYNHQLDDLRKKFASLVPVDRPSQDGDFLSVDLVAKQGDKEVEKNLNQSIEIKSDGLSLEGIYKNVLGVKAGDVKTFESNLVGGDHAGEPAQIELTVKSVKTLNLPELDDDFAKLASQFSTYAEFEADLKKSVSANAQNLQLNYASQKLTDLLIEKIEVPIPPQMTERMIASEKYKRMGAIDEKEVEKLNKSLMEAEPEIREHVESEAKLEIILESLARKTQAQVTQEGLAEFIYQNAAASSQDPAEYLKQVQESGQLPYFISHLRNLNGLRIFLSQIVIKDTQGAVLDFGLPQPVQQPVSAETATTESIGTESTVADSAAASSSSAGTAAKKTKSTDSESPAANSIDTDTAATEFTVAESTDTSETAATEPAVTDTKNTKPNENKSTDTNKKEDQV